MNIFKAINDRLKENNITIKGALNIRTNGDDKVFYVSDMDYMTFALTKIGVYFVDTDTLVLY